MLSAHRKFLGRAAWFVLGVVIAFRPFLVASPPSAMFHDVLVVHDSLGPNPFYPVDGEVDQDNLQKIGFSFVPFYLHSKGAKDAAGSKVFEGDRLGRWFMIGLVHGAGAAPGGSLSGGSTPNLLAAQTALGAAPGPSRFTYTDNTFTDSRNNFGSFSIPIEYRKFGLRGNFVARFMYGFQFRMRAGVVHYEQTPSFLDQTLNAVGDFPGVDMQLTITHLMDAPARTNIFNEIGMNVDRESHTAFEDLHAELSWHQSFGFNDEHHLHAVSVIPHIAFGCWFPTGRKNDQDKFTSLSTGNDGFFGLTLDGGFNFAFPGTVHVGVGGAFSYFQKKLETDKRLPSSNSQSGIYPWKASVKRRLGTTWNVHAGIHAPRFLDKLSGYFNYIFTRHERDSITMVDTASRNALFIPAKFEQESSFHAQSLHGGLKYEITPELLVGAAVNFHLTGRRMYRTTTILGDLEFRF